MSYTDLNGKRRRRSARIQSRSLDTIPEAVYQNILGYLLGNYMNEIFRKNYSLQFISKTFQRSFQRYLKTNPLELRLEDDEAPLQLIKIVKKYDIHLYELHIVIYDFFDCPSISKVMYGINFSSLRKLVLFVKEIDFELFKDCKKLKHFELNWEYVLDDEIKAQKLKNFLFDNKNTLEYIELHFEGKKDSGKFYDILPEDLHWPNLKTLNIADTDIMTFRFIKSDTLQHLVLYYPYVDMAIKCPNLKVLHIVHMPYDIEPDYREERSYDGCYYRFDETCHPDKLMEIGIFLYEVSDDCDIGICS